ncbi:MAG: acyltransferase [Endomicrobium sp.]|nr:acyltransferase [Endomicrobium sp.]
MKYIITLINKIKIKSADCIPFTQLRHLLRAYANNNTITIVKTDGRIIKNPLFLKKLKVSIKGSGHFLKIYENIEGSLRINSKCPVNITIGKGSYIHKLEVTNFSIENNVSKIVIGENFFCNESRFYLDGSGNGINIGNSCMFSWNVSVHTSDHHAIFDCKTQKQINHSKSVHIGRNVLVGAGTVILKGGGISDNSIMGANSVVTKYFSQNNIMIAGNPARIIKTGVDWQR